MKLRLPGACAKDALRTKSRFLKALLWLLAVAALAYIASRLSAQNPNTAAFPTTLATDSDLLAAKRLSESTLSATITAGTLTVTVADGTQFINYEVIRMDNEEMKVCTVSSNTLTICSGGRGFNGSTAASHAAGVSVRGIITSWHHNQGAAEIKAMQARLQSTTSSCQDAGSTDAYACNLAPAITSYATGLLVTFKANTANTGAATLALNGLSAQTIKKRAVGSITTDLATNDIVAGQWVALVYDGTNFQLQSQTVATGAGGLTDPGAGMVASNGAGTTFARAITAGTGTTCVNGNGQSGNPTCGVDTATVPTYLTATAVLDFPAIVDMDCADLTMTLTGAATGDAVALGVPTTIPSKVSMTPFVSSANTITVRACYFGGATDANPASGTYRATITRSF